jgi:hypothetical protein
MATSLQQKKWDQHMRVWATLDKGENPLSCEEIYFVQTCCQILKVNSDDKVALIASTAVDDGRGDPTLTVMEIQKFLEASGAMARLSGG